MNNLQGLSYISREVVPGDAQLPQSYQASKPRKHRFYFWDRNRKKEADIMIEEGLKERRDTIAKIKEHVLTILLRKAPYEIRNSDGLRKASSESSLNSSLSNDSITSANSERREIRLTPFGSPTLATLTRRFNQSPKHVKVQRLRSIERSHSFTLKPALRREGSVTSDSDSATSSPQTGRHVTFSKYALLLAAASEDSVSELQILLDKDPNYVNKPSSSGQTPLHKAASKGNKACVELLIERGADPNFADKRGRTPMLTAWEKGHHDCFKIMLTASRNNCGKNDN